MITSCQCIPGTTQSTSPVPWDINVAFKETLVFQGLGRGDVLKFVLKDIALFKQEHFFGNFGPKIIGDTILIAGTDFEGYMELRPCKEGLGYPVLKVAARFLTSGGAGEIMTGPGPLLQQALAMASAPLMEEEAMMRVDQTDDAPIIEASKPSEEVGTLGRAEPSTSPAVGTCAEPSASPEVGTLGRPDDMMLAESGRGEVAMASSGALGSSDVPALIASPPASGALGSAAPALIARASATSNPFYIDPEVLNLTPPNLLLEHLAKMQDRKLKWPFPPGGLRNYNVFAAGWQPTTGEWSPQHLWEPIPDECRPPYVNEVYERMHSLGVAGWDVGVLCALLALLKAALARVQYRRSIGISKRARTWHATHARRTHAWCQAHVATGARTVGMLD